MSTALKRPLIVAVAGLGVVLYAALVPPARTEPFLTGIPAFSGLSVDTALYVERFLLSFLLLGAGPVAAVLVTRPGGTTAGYRVPGLARPAAYFSWKHIAAYVALGAAAGGVGVLSSGLAAYYPYHPRLPELARQAAWVFPAHAAAYLLAYYLPWELLFRGILIIPFLPADMHEDSAPVQAYAVASLQAIPSALLHFGHPVSESVSAVIFGLFAGWLVVKTRSIYPGLIVHATAGISLDLLIVLTS